MAQEYIRRLGRKIKKEGQKFVMSKPVGKVLDSKVGKTMVKVGDKALAPIKWAGKQIEKQMKMDKEKDDKYREEGEEYRNNPDNYR